MSTEEKHQNNALAEYERRALEAEKKIKLLMERCEQLEHAANIKHQSNSNSTPGTQGNVTSFLRELETIKEEWIQESNAHKKEVKQLKKENEKLKYRIVHLLRSLETEEKENEQLKNRKFF